MATLRTMYLTKAARACAAVGPFAAGATEAEAVTVAMLRPVTAAIAAAPAMSRDLKSVPPLDARGAGPPRSALSFART